MVVEEVLATVLVGGFLAYFMWLVNSRVTDNLEKITTIRRRQDLFIIVMSETQQGFAEKWDAYKARINPDIPSIGRMKAELFGGRE